MNLIPWHSKRSSGAAASQPDIRREMAHLFNRMFEEDPFERESGLMGLSPGMGFGPRGEFMPAIDVSEDEHAVTVRAELPGVDPASVNVEMIGTSLSISGEKEESKEDRGKDYYRSERTFGSFMRRIELPESADPDRASADYENGVLSVRFEKRPDAASKKIPVSGRTGRGAPPAGGPI